MGLTHLFFSDDVLFFSHGSQESVMHIMNSIARFSNWNGLTPGIHKSNSYLCNCDSDFTTWFDSLLIPRGNLPVQFLGVPLISTQLCVNDWPDLLLWNGIDAAKAKTWDIWDSIRFKAEMVPWHTGVWHKLRVNRYAHHQWVFCHGRLQTLARLHRFGLVESQQCFLGICARETDSHIFLHCSYSNWILRSLMAPLDIVIHGESWNSFITYLIHLADKTKSILALCCAQIFCYHIWRERNARAHDSDVFGPRKLLTGIHKDFIARLNSSAWFSKVLDSRLDFIHFISL
ncbi:uncharacterized protein LOC141685322 [Apium graveolens]|uniref:uncharacterized protein LOC141685322 n=1 Tax=Apium graveolens TaxID=4045 RepID=UPI003D7A4FF6